MGLNQVAQIGMMGNIALATGVIGATTATAAGLAGYTYFGSIPAAARTAGGLLKGLRDDAIPPPSAPQPPVSTPAGNCPARRCESTCATAWHLS
jgi:hypothetical protein